MYKETEELWRNEVIDYSSTHYEGLSTVRECIPKVSPAGNLSLLVVVSRGGGISKRWSLVVGGYYATPELGR